MRSEEIQNVLRQWVPEESGPDGGSGRPEDDYSPVVEIQEGSPLDRTVLAGLRGLQVEGEPDILDEPIELFLSNEPTQLAALREAVKVGDARSVERISHTLRGSCGNMGAARMEAICAELERTGRSEDLSAATGKFSQLEQEYERVRAALERERSGGTG